MSSASFDWDGAPPPLSEQIAAQFLPNQAEADNELLSLDAPSASKRGRRLSSNADDLPHKQAAGPARLPIAPDVTLQGKRYAGRKTTREEMQRLLGVEQDEDDDEGSGSGRRAFEDHSDEQGDSGDQDEDQDEDALPMEGDDDNEEVLEGGEDDEDEADTSGIMQVIAASQRAELAKAKAVEKQVWQYQRALGARIRLQGAVSAANKLPLPSSSRQQSNGSSAACVEGALAEITEAIGELAELQRVNEPCPPVTASAAEWWQWCDRHVNQARVQRDEAIVEEWNRRTDLSLGALAGAGGRAFKALGRPVMEQIRYALRNDMSRLIKRTQLNRAQAIPVGQSSAPEYVEHIYDDGDFYGQLLKSFIEASTSAKDSVTATKVMRQQQSHKLSREEKKRRRMQADMSVKQELLNFMAPLASTQLPPMAEPLFASLFV